MTPMAASCSARSKCSSTSGCRKWATKLLFSHLEALGEQARILAFEPDAGIWEYRGRERVHTYSAALCWAACDRLGQIARRLDLPERAQYWARSASAIASRILAEAWDEKRGALTGALGQPDLDASVLLLARLGLLSPSDERFRRTCETIGRELMRNGRIMRYTAEDDFGAPETAFLACNFWYVDALAADRPQGRSARNVRGHPLLPQFVRAAVGRHSSRDGRALGQFSASLFDGGDHQYGDASVVELGGGMGMRLIIVSNRVAAPRPKASRRCAGGLAVAVKAALRNRTGVWFGWSGEIDENRDGAAALRRAQSRHLRRHRPLGHRFPGILQRPRQPRAVADPALSRRSAGIFARRPDRLHARQPPLRRPARRLHQRTTTSSGCTTIT